MTLESPDAYIRIVTHQRQEKDAFFRASPHSPIPFQERKAFKGLRYFPPNPAYRVIATVEELPAQAIIEMTTSDGQRRPFVRFALLHFVIEGTPLHLTAYRALHEHGEAELFVPFRDALAGRETYGAGRYLDIPFTGGEDTHQSHAAHQSAPERLVLDFNEAYNPYCAYNDAYSCPIPPSENTLPTAIRAGEQIYRHYV